MKYSHYPMIRTNIFINYRKAMKYNKEGAVYILNKL